MHFKFSISLYTLNIVCVCVSVCVCICVYVCVCNERGNFLSAADGGTAYSIYTSTKSPSIFSACLTNITVLLTQSHTAAAT